MTRVRRFSVNGQMLTITEIAARYNIKRATVCNRLYMGWPIADVIGKPIRLSGRGAARSASETHEEPR